MTSTQATERQIIRQLLQGRPARSRRPSEQLIAALAVGAGLLALLLSTPELFGVCLAAALLVSLGLR